MYLFRQKSVSISNSLLATYAFILVSHIDFVISSSSDENWNTLKSGTMSRLAAKPRYPGKQLPSSMTKSNSLSFGGSGRKFSGVSPERSGNPDKSVSPRQGGGGSGGGGWGGWGGGWPSSYGGGGGSYDVYTIIAVAAFAALFGALIYELLGGTLRRSMDTPTFNLPPVTLGLESEKLPEVMVKIGDWIANSSWFDNIGNNSRTIRDLSDKIGVRKWFEAFKKDPVEYQCVRKMACETLASSTLAARSLNSNLGGVFLSTFGSFIENGDELRSLVNNVVGNPKKCEEMIVGGYCEEN